jgi:hypothetical protein
MTAPTAPPKAFDEWWMLCIPAEFQWAAILEQAEPWMVEEFKKTFRKCWTAAVAATRAEDAKVVRDAENRVCCDGQHDFAAAIEGLE